MQKSPPNPVPFRPSPAKLGEQIRKLAADSKNVGWSAHAMERMELRDITTLDALRVLRIGEVVGPIEPGKYTGEWKCKMVAGRKGGRDVGVVTLVLAQGRLKIKTVEYEDR